MRVQPLEDLAFPGHDGLAFAPARRRGNCAQSAARSMVKVRPARLRTAWYSDRW